MLASATVAPPVLDTVTIHVLEVPLASVAGAQLSPVTITGAPSVIDADCVDPFNDAVTVATWSVAIVPAIAVNVAVIAPDGTATDAGIARAALLSDSATIPPEMLERVTAHVLAAPAFKDVGVQLKPVMVGDTTEVTKPPVPMSDNGCPS